MTQANSDVTLLVGPQTRLACALNDVVRTSGADIAAAGVTALPNRIAAPAIRAATAADFSDDERHGSLASALCLGDGHPVFLSAISLLGAPAAAYRGQELFPDAARLVVTIEPLHHFLFSLASPTLHQRVADSPWEALFEISWSDLIAELSEAFPSRQVLVLTPDAAFAGARTLLSEFFGAAGTTIDPAILQKQHLTPDGQAALTMIRAAGEPEPDILEELLAAYRATPDPGHLEARTGIDKLTSTLLDQRFLEDLSDLDALPNVRLL